MVAVMMRITKK